jgi:predicted nucleic acid-binding Zn ribbon protein
MKRQFTNSGGFKLKGDGWFKDGYTKDNKWII